MAKNAIAAFVLVLATFYALYLYFGRVQTLDPKIQNEIEAQIPECAERDIAAKKLTDQNRGYYYKNDFDAFDKKADECFKKSVKKLNEKRG